MPASQVMHKWKHGQLHSGSKKGPIVKSQKQAIAIMMSEKRKGLQTGGDVAHKQTGGAETGAAPIAAPMPSADAPNRYAGLGGMLGGLGQTPGGIGSMPPGIGQMGPPQWRFGQQQSGQQFSQQSPQQLQQWPQQLQQRWHQQLQQQWPQLGLGAMGRPSMQFGGGLGGSWLQHQEMRNLMREGMHTGPIISAVGGRTDHHAINVPSGSYVLPAAHVSALGQGNTINGMQILKNMFGPPMKMGRGMGLPKMGMRAPGLPKGLSGGFSAGGARHSNSGRPVPIMAAGGEYVLSPHQVARVGNGDLDRGHAILDHWVKSTHKKYAKTVANLPAPAKT